MININKANNAEGFSAFAEIKTPDMFESNRPAVETSSNPSSAFNVFADMKKPDVFETRPKPEDSKNNEQMCNGPQLGALPPLQSMAIFIVASSWAPATPATDGHLYSGLILGLRHSCNR